MRPASNTKFAVAAILGSLCWLGAWLVGAWLIEHTDVIGFGLKLTLASVLVSFAVLCILNWIRKREERRYDPEAGGRDDPI